MSKKIHKSDIARARVVNEAHEMVSVDDLTTHPGNPRRGDLAAVKASIEVNGFYGTIVAQRSTGYVLAGNHRLMAARELGMSEVPVVWVDCDDTRARAILAADNRTSELGGFDSEALATLLEGLRIEDALEGTGYDQGDINALLAELEPPPVLKDDAEIDPSQAELLAQKWGVQEGQLWALGPHRIICGDSTQAEVAARVLEGVKPHLMVTDPPYGVDYDADWRNHAKRSDGSTIGASAVGVVQNDGQASWLEAYRHFEGDVAYVWHASRFASVVERDLSELGFELRAQIIWAKTNFAISRGHYHWQHEPCWYAVRKGGTGHWAGDRKQTTLWQIEKPQKSETGHSTQKPIECMGRPILNHTVSGDVVYDPFSGSGTTLMACEQMGRVARVVEIHPPYVALAIERWHRETGLTPELIP